MSYTPCGGLTTFLLGAEPLRDRGDDPEDGGVRAEQHPAVKKLQEKKQTRKLRLLSQSQ